MAHEHYDRELPQIDYEKGLMNELDRGELLILILSENPLSMLDHSSVYSQHY